MAIFTVITGASRGIGKAIASECAKRGFNLVLVSLPEEDLGVVGTQLSEQHGIKTVCYETDLTVQGAVDEFYTWCLQRELSINMLINNAGLGMQGKFEHASAERISKMMRLNMDALVAMCRKALPLLRKQEKSYILNVGSIGSFMPVPYKAVYTSTKHFVRNFTEALHYELKDSPVLVGCLCPGPIITSKEHRAKVKEVGLVARLLTLETDEVARRAIEGLLKEKRLIIPGIGNKVLVRLSKLLPAAVSLKLAASAFENSSFNHQ